MMKKLFNRIALFAFLVLAGFTYAGNLPPEEKAGGENFRNSGIMPEAFQRRWTLVSETSAVIYWQLDEISSSALSYVEFGPEKNPGSRTSLSKKPRWSQLHRLTGLTPGKTCYYRMVNVDPATGNKSESELLQITPRLIPGAVHIPDELPGGPPYILDKPHTRYILTRDIQADGSAFELRGEGSTLDLDGHTVTFGMDTPEQVYGVRLTSRDSSKLVNGIIVQGDRSHDYSAAIASLDRTFERPATTEICGISTDVKLKDTWPMNFTHIAQLEVHHNSVYSRVTELECRHYPGNVLIRVYTWGGDIHIHDNLLTEGCHWGIVVKEQSPSVKNVEIDHNDIQHHQQYVNGYAISPCAFSDVHHNRITSTGRGIHMTAEGILLHDNYLDTKGHMTLSDLPERTRPFHHRMIELHGIKLEGSRVRNCRIYNNFVRITQQQPVDSGGMGDPVNKMENGVYIRSRASGIAADRLTDDSKNWEKDRWRHYYLKYSPDHPPVLIDSSDSRNLYARLETVPPGNYSVYMKWNYVAPTPLNIACYDPNAMNEIYNNTFIGITTYKNTRHGEYGDSGEWATAIMFIAMTKGEADPGKYSAWVHDNQFFSNDLFYNSGWDVNMTIKIEDNTFTLLKDPFTTGRDERIHEVGPWFNRQIKAAQNTYNE